MNSLESVLFDLHADYNIRDLVYFFKYVKKCLITCIRGNHKPFMNKRLSKAIMQRIRFRNKFLKIPADENRYIYTKQRNLCVSLLRKEKKQYFTKLNEKYITGNRKF